ncbi:MAG TPA: class II glutamine amidotransferase [Acidimicrobiales bacterium]|nr:class II glutamine amidotransferase [Acidimicrobiales bacterium]
MCRLLAYVSESPRSVEDLLGPTEFTSFRELSHLHRDGWGMSWLAARDDAASSGGETGVRLGGDVRARRSVLPAYEDPAFDALAGRRLGRAGFVHLRWATSGLAVTASNTHPFLGDGWAFAHQGSIPSTDHLDALLAPEWLGRRQGTTDSEGYFLYLLQCFEQTGSLVGGAQKAVTDIVRACGLTSLNAILLSSSSLLVVHGRAGLEPPRDDLLAAVARPEDVPPDHLEAYFRLRYRRVDDSLVITSSGVAGQGWEQVPEDSIVQVDLHTREMSIHPFDSSTLAGVAAETGTRPVEL